MNKLGQLGVIFGLMIVVACQQPISSKALLHDQFSFTDDSWQQFVEQTQASAAVQERLLARPVDFLNLAQQMLAGDETLLYLVDKQHMLAAEYAPDDLVSLDTLTWVQVNRKGHWLRQAAVLGLQQMHEASLKDEVTLLVSSTYRSYKRQQEVYAGWVNQLGQTQADRLSAKAGTSQHQLGTTIDFGSINASFTGTKMQRWLAEHAHRFGFSLSYPKGFEPQTGYDYESWHYRYIGRPAAAMQREFFDDLQYQLLTFWHQHAKQLQANYHDTHA